MTTRRDAGLPDLRRAVVSRVEDEQIEIKRWPLSVLLVWLIVFMIGGAFAVGLVRILQWMAGGGA